jgi:predicted transcriptional regulator
MKAVKSFRLSDATARALETLARRWGVSQADVLAILVAAAESGDYDQVDEMVDLAKKL